MSGTYTFDTRRVSYAKWLKALAVIAVVIMVLVTTTRLTPLPGASAGADLDSGGSMLRQLVFPICAAMILLASKPFHKPGRLLRFPLSLTIVLVWCAISTLWSVSPPIAMRRLILTFLVIWSTFRAVDVLGYRHFLRILCYTFIGLLIANYIAIPLSPAAIHGQAERTDPSVLGAWRGIIPHKNHAGPLCVMTIFLLAFGIGRFPLLVRLCLIAATAFFLVKTNSKTSMALCIVAMSGGYLMKFYTPRMRALITPIIAAGAGVVAVALDILLPHYLDDLDSSTDAFTGRIQIWRVLLAYIHDNPMLGAGFQSFWAAGDRSPVLQYSNQTWIVTQVTEGHNGYLDIVSQLGLIGLGLTLLPFFIVPMAKLIYEGDIRDTDRSLIFALLFFSFGHNFTESSLLASDQFMEFMMIAALACLEDIRQPTRQQRRARFLKWVAQMGEDVRLIIFASMGKDPKKDRN